MANIIKKKDNDKKYVFTCPICGTIFTERERNIEPTSIYEAKIEQQIGIIGEAYNLKCPNCGVSSTFEKLEEYNKNKDYE